MNRSANRLSVLVLGFVLMGCATARYEDSHVESGSSRRSTSGRAAGIGLGLGILSTGASAIAGGGSDGQEQNQQQKKEQSAEEAEKAKNQY
jgi:hypothetical protein